MMFGPDLNPVNTFTGTINIIGNQTIFQVGPATTTIPSSVSVNVGAARSSTWIRPRWPSTV